jgi:hypothetical protein
LPFGLPGAVAACAQPVVLAGRALKRRFALFVGLGASVKRLSYGETRSVK